MKRAKKEKRTEPRYKCYKCGYTGDQSISGYANYGFGSVHISEKVNNVCPQCKSAELIDVHEIEDKVRESLSGVREAVKEIFKKRGKEKTK